MSRVGKRPVPIPDGVDVSFKAKGSCQRAKRELSRSMHDDVNLKVEDGEIRVSVSGNGKKAGALQGLTRTLVANMIHGATQGFERVLEIVGVGYRVEPKSNILILCPGVLSSSGFKLPEGITASVEKTKVVWLELTRNF